MAIICPSAGPRLCSAQRNQPQRSLLSNAIRTGHALRLIPRCGTQPLSVPAARLRFYLIRSSWSAGLRFLIFQPAAQLAVGSIRQRVESHERRLHPRHIARLRAVLQREKIF